MYLTELYPRVPRERALRRSPGYQALAVFDVAPVYMHLSGMHAKQSLVSFRSQSEADGRPAYPRRPLPAGIAHPPAGT